MGHKKIDVVMGGFVMSFYFIWLYSRNSVMSHSGNRQISTESER